MKRENIIQILRHYIEWRRDKEKIPVSPILIERAIDAAIQELENPTDLLIKFSNFINTYPGLEDVRFDFMVIDFLDKRPKPCEHEFKKLDAGYTFRCRKRGLEP